MSDAVTYKEIHAYMLKKTAEYCHCPPLALVEETMAQYEKAGVTLSLAEAQKLVTPIQVQRLVKEEMQKKWPDFMSSIPSNPLRSE